MRDERFDAVVIQADGVEHAAWRLDGAPRLVARARLLCDGLRQYPAEATKIDQVLHFSCISEGTGGDENGVRQPQSAKLYGEVNRVTWRRRHGAEYSK